MVSISTGKFRTILLIPTGKLLDCRCGSLILPGTDGEFGILRNHAPMMCSLGQGIMQVREIPNEKDKFYLLEGGFARIAENNITVLAYEVLSFEGAEHEQMNKMLHEAKELIHGGAYITTQRGQQDRKRARLLIRMAGLSKIDTSIL